MNIDLQENNDEIILLVELKFRGKKGKTKTFTSSNAVQWINENYPLIKLGKLVSAPKKNLNNIDRFKGTWTFKLYKENTIDISNNNVKINKIIKAESPKKEQKNEASLPYGLKKQTKTKRKRATKNKTTEE